MDVNALQGAVADASENLPSSREEYLKKTFHSGQNKFRIRGPVKMTYLGFVTDKEGKSKPVYTKGPKLPDPLKPSQGFLYKDPATGQYTGEPVDPLSRLCAKMRVSADPKMRERGAEWDPMPVYMANVIDVDNPKVHAESGHLALLCNSPKGSHFSHGIANDITTALRNFGSEDCLANYETHEGKGLLFITNKTGTNKGTRYSTSAVPAPAPLTDAEKAYVPYDLDKVASLTTMEQLREWLGDEIFVQHGISLSELAEKDEWIPHRDKEGNIIPARKGPGSGAAVVTNAAPPPGVAAAAPPPPPAAAAPPPPAPAAPAGKPGPDGTPLPVGWSWAPNPGNGNKPYYWKDGDPASATNDRPTA